MIEKESLLRNIIDQISRTDDIMNFMQKLEISYPDDACIDECQTIIIKTVKEGTREYNILICLGIIHSASNTGFLPNNFPDLNNLQSKTFSDEDIENSINLYLSGNHGNREALRKILTTTLTSTKGSTDVTT